MDPSTCELGVDKQTPDVISRNISPATRREQDGRQHAGHLGARNNNNMHQEPEGRKGTELACGRPVPSLPPSSIENAPQEPEQGEHTTDLRAARQQPTTGHCDMERLPDTAGTDPGPGPPEFRRIRKVCEKGNYETANIDLRPEAFIKYKKQNWPHAVPGTLTEDMVKIYDVVRETGLPNSKQARTPVPTNLDLPAWEAALDEIGGRPLLMDFLTYGFPLGYVGPISHNPQVENHPSATDFPAQISAFLEKEKALGGVVGPFNTAPFDTWCHTSPLMSRPKAKEGERRVITDMTFPPETSVNAYIVKNGIFGIEMEHSLPTVDSLVQELKTRDKGAYLSTLDISRAYKNFMSDPIDWPLLCFKWLNKFYCDVTVPFGSRASSFHMQTVANAIVDILATRGVKSFMYLDDLVIVSHDRHTAQRDFQAARQLLRDLALPEATDKAQEPAQVIRWLGININTTEMSLSIPEDKLRQVLETVRKYEKARSVSKKTLQSILGLLLHVAKCVRPARLFVSRLLEALRAATGTYVNVNADMRADFRWFLEFGTQWNGKSYIPEVAPNRDIYVDACLSGIGATDGTWAYAGQVAPLEDGVNNITELEAVNVIIALHTFLKGADARSHIRIHCDNMAAVQVLQSGRAKNKILLDCARAAWMVQAVLDVQLTYVHVPGKENQAADILSRAHLGKSDHLLAKALITKNAMIMIDPCLYVCQVIPTPMLSRSGNGVLTGQGQAPTARVKGPRDVGQPAIHDSNIRGLHQTDRGRLLRTRPVHNGSLHRVLGRIHRGSPDNTKQDITCANIPTDGWRADGRHRSPDRRPGHRGALQEQGIQEERQTPGPNGHTKVGGLYYTKDYGGRGDKAGHTPHVLWGAPTVGGGPPYCKKVRPGATSYVSRCNGAAWAGKVGHKMGQEHAEDRRGAHSDPTRIQRPRPLPGQGTQNSLRPHPDSLLYRPPVNVPGLTGSHSPISDKKRVGHGPYPHGRGYQSTLPPQPQKGGSDPGPQRRLWRAAHSETRRLEIISI